jgi:hypothetical protein
MRSGLGQVAFGAVFFQRHFDFHLALVGMQREQVRVRMGFISRKNPVAMSSNPPREQIADHRGKICQFH